MDLKTVEMFEGLTRSIENLTCALGNSLEICRALRERIDRLEETVGLEQQWRK